MAKQKFSSVEIALLVLLGLQLVLGHVLRFVATFSLDALVFIIFYLLAFVFVFKKDHRGPLLVFIIVALQVILILLALAKGVTIFGVLWPLIFIILMSGLSYKLWKDAGGKNLGKDLKKMVTKK